MPPRATASQVLAAAILFEGGLGLIAVVVGRFLSRTPAAQIAWQWSGVGWGVVASLPLVAALLVLRHLPWQPLVRLNRTVDELIGPLFAECGWADSQWLRTAGRPGRRAILSRTSIQQAGSQWISPAVGLVVASVLFGLAHPITLTYALLAIACGFYWGACSWTDNLLVPIVTHALYDFMALAYLVPRGDRPGASD